ncbi:hypothetical protein P4S52_13560 [Vibrio sp. SA48]
MTIAPGNEQLLIVKVDAISDAHRLAKIHGSVGNGMFSQGDKMIIYREIVFGIYLDNMIQDYLYVTA